MRTKADWQHHDGEHYRVAGSQAPENWFDVPQFICPERLGRMGDLNTTVICNTNSVSQPPQDFLTFFPNGWKFLVQILHAYYTFLSTLD